MSVCKIIDTCSLINLFDMLHCDVSVFFSRYQSVITDVVCLEYTQKYPRKVSDSISVVPMDDADGGLYEDLEYLFPNLGPGERSAFAKAVFSIRHGEKAIIITDDIKAVRGFKRLCREKQFIGRYPEAESVVMVGSKDVLQKMLDVGCISQDEYTESCSLLNL